MDIFPQKTTTPALLGGKPIRDKHFPPRKTMGHAESDAVKRVLDSDVLSAFLGASGTFFNGGPEVKNFENAWGSKFGFRHVISVNSWTSGLMAAVGAVGIEPGDEVICSPYTMSASATSAFFYGGIPVFADIDPETFCLSPESVKSRITARTKAIIVVHLFGHPADMDALIAIAKPRGIKIIEDAAQAPGALYKGRPVGAIGDIGGFSLNYHKHIHTGEGGLLVTNNDDLAARCQLIRNHGENAIDMFPSVDISNIIGGNFRLTELQAAIGIEQLHRLDDIIVHRQRLAHALNMRLQGIDGLSVQQIPPGCTHSYYMYPIKYDETRIGLPRGTFVKAVAAELPRADSWETTPLAEGYVKPLYLNTIYQSKIAIGRRGFPFNVHGIDYDYSKGICPVAERLYEKVMLLTPLVREPLTVDDINDFADAIVKVIEHAETIKGSYQPSGSASIFDPAAALDETTK